MITFSKPLSVKEMIDFLISDEENEKSEAELDNNEESLEESPIHLRAIQKGIKAGEKASRRHSSSYDTQGTESFSDELARIRRTAKQRQERYVKMDSLSKYLKKVFEQDAMGGVSNASVNLADDVVAIISAKTDSFAGIDNPKFIISIRKGNKELLNKEMFAGIGVKQKIAKLLKKIQKNLQEDKKMKITKAHLKEMVRKVVKNKLQEMELVEREKQNGDFDEDDDNNKKMSDEELAAHLRREREKAQRLRAQKKRHAAKQTARGMELESSHQEDYEDAEDFTISFDEDELEEAKLCEVAYDKDDFYTAYIDAALWSTLDKEGEPLDKNYTVDDISKETLDYMVKDAQKFLDKAGDLFAGREGEAGHDFWLTRNGHGAGFWDGDWGKHGEELARLASDFGEMYLYVGDDGMIHDA